MLGHVFSVGARGLGVACLVLGLGASACGGDKPAPAAEQPAPEPQAPVEAPRAPEPAAATGPRCGDLLSASDLTGIGIDAKSLLPDGQPQDGRGAQCTGLPVMATVFLGSDFADIVAGYKANAGAAGLVEVEGPKIGGASIWTAMDTMSHVMFQSANKHFAANITGTDKTQVEKLARVLAANMEKH